MTVHNPVRDSLDLIWICGVPVSFSRYRFPTISIVMNFKEFDLILGLNWFTKYEAEVKCAERVVKAKTKFRDYITNSCEGPNSDREDFWSALDVSPAQIEKILVVTENTPVDIENIPVVKNYAYVFEKVVILPSRREIDFKISLIPNARPVVHTIRRMNLKEKEELDNQTR